jgi:riboflavin kinase/FMN adenylyltransferase
MGPRVALSIGNFDGVHRGHVELVSAARKAVGDGGRVVVLTFDPHPVTILRPDPAGAGAETGTRAGAWGLRLTDMEQRRCLLEAAGVDEVIRLEPTRELLAQDPQDFVAGIVERHRPAFIVEGPDFRFGRDRAGSIETLRGLESRHGYETVVIEPVEARIDSHHVVRVSSTMIRWLISRGRVRDAAALIGRPYELRGPVVSGDRRGRTIGVPTANLDHLDRLLPADGVYAGSGVAPDGRAYPAAISVGRKPTFGDADRICEAHLVGYDGPVDDYGWTMRLDVHHWLRDQIRYAELNQLVDQLARDVARADAMFPGSR